MKLIRECLEKHNYDKHLLVVADCNINKEFIMALSDDLKVNVDIIYVDTSRSTKKGLIYKHISYLFLACIATHTQNKYDIILFWQQFIGIYWGIINRFYTQNRITAVITPLIIKMRNGFIGSVQKFVLSAGLSNPQIALAICHARQEKELYCQYLPNCAAKIVFVPYGQARIDQKNEISLVSGEYIFSGGTSNRDYSTFFKAMEQIKMTAVVACMQKDIEGLQVPKNVKVLHNAYGEDFNNLLANSLAVVIPIDDGRISSGQIVLLRAMSLGKPIIASKSGATDDYINNDCAYLVSPKDSRELRDKIKFVITHKDYANKKGIMARKRYSQEFSMKALGGNIACLLNQVPNSIQEPPCIM